MLGYKMLSQTKQNKNQSRKVIMLFILKFSEFSVFFLAETE